MLKLPPPKGASGPKATVLEPSVPPTNNSVSTTLITQSLDVVTRGRTNVKASPSDLRPVGAFAAEERSSYSQEQETFETQKTAQALTRVVEAKVANTNQTQVALNAANPNKTSTFVKVAGSVDGVTGQATQDRVFRLVEKAVDPLEPAKFKFRAVPKGPGSPPVPILHSPSKKATEEEKAAWNIPKSISNWNNSKGFVISLEQRLAQTEDIQAPTVNNRFAAFAEALFSAEDAKRIELNERAKLKSVNEEKAREAENESLRIAAAQARAARAKSAAISAPTTGANAMPVASVSRGSDTPPMPLKSVKHERSPSPSSASESSGGHRGRSTRDEHEEDDEQARKERERILRHRKRELDREMKREAAGKRTKSMREEERDISERIALGMPVPKGTVGSLDTEFDHRLFNRGGAGVSAGHGADDEDAVYSTSLFRDKAKDVYKPSSQVRETKSAKELQGKLDEIKSESKFVMESRGFKGAEGPGGGSSQRQGPVQFEKSAGGLSSVASAAADDILQGIGLSQPQRRTADALDSLSSKRAATLSSGRFAGDVSASKPQYSLDEPDEREIAEERMIKKLKEKESRSKTISFVKGSE